jgi:phage terminase small subunit
MAKEPKQARKKRSSGMTAKQAAFVREYLIDLNATQAAIRAGYSAKTANVQAVEIMATPRVKAAIDAAIANRSQETKIDAAWVLKRLAMEAEADIADLYGDDGQLLPVKKWPLIWRQGLVQGIEVEELFEGKGEDREQIGVLRKIKLDSRIKRIELVGKHVGVNAFQDQVKIAGVDELADRIARAKAKLGGKR